MICCLLGSLNGCASNPVDLPDWDIVPSKEVVQPQQRLPEIPSPVSSTEDTVTFSKDSFSRLVAYTIVAGGNYEIGAANEAALEAQIRAYNMLIEAGKLQKQFTQIRDEQLQREIRDHTMDNWFHRGIIALAILVSL